LFKAGLIRILGGIVALTQTELEITLMVCCNLDGHRYILSWLISPCNNSVGKLAAWSLVLSRVFSPAISADTAPATNSGTVLVPGSATESSVVVIVDAVLRVPVESHGGPRWRLDEGGMALSPPDPEQQKQER